MQTPLTTTTRRHVLLALMAGATLLALLTAFQQVVSHAVQRGASMRSATSLQADAAWRCRLQGMRPPSETCRVPAGGTPR
jgi:hypothetical protein